tara:strand:- start:6510 stop:8306 length:1797 start_codon:yes stop_codon:yes gene_type:complete
MIIFLQYPFDLKKLETLKNQNIITFDHKSHKILLQHNIVHKQSEEFLNEEDFDVIENKCHEWAQWFNQEKIREIVTYNKINLGSLYIWEFYYYLIPIIKKIIEIEKISEKINESECVCSSFLEGIAKNHFKVTKLFDKIKEDNSLLFDNVKWNLTNNLEINIKKENFEKMKKISEKVLLNFSRLNQNKDDNEKSILFVEFDPIKYENLYSKISDTKIKPIFFNYRRPYFWDIRSFKIINQTGGEIIRDRGDFNHDDQKNFIYKKIYTLNEIYFQRHFSINNRSYWNIIKKDFFKIFNRKIEDGIKIIHVGEKLIQNKKIDEIIIWSENGFSEQVIIKLGKKMNIPISLIQHGIIVDNDSARNNRFNRFSGVIPTESDKYLVWNKSTLNYINSLGFSNENIIQIGNPSFDTISTNKKYLENDYILLTTTGPRKSQHAGYNSRLLDNYEYQLSLMCKKIKEQNKKLIVRPHPFSKEFKIDQIVTDSYPEAKIDKKTDINVLIKNSKVVICYGISTIIYDAQIQEKPVFFINTEHDILGIPKYVKNNPKLMIKFDEIGNYISKIYSDLEYNNQIINNNSNIIVNDFFNLGNSSEKFLEMYE